MVEDFSSEERSDTRVLCASKGLPILPDSPSGQAGNAVALGEIAEQEAFGRRRDYHTVFVVHFVLAVLPIEPSEEFLEDAG